MASEILAIPEENLADVIAVIRIGLNNVRNLHADVREHLTKWCDDEEAYLERLAND
jgi:hypothetical protein